MHVFPANKARNTEPAVCANRNRSNEKVLALKQKTLEQDYRAQLNKEVPYRSRRCPGPSYCGSHCCNVSNEKLSRFHRRDPEQVRGAANKKIQPAAIFPHGAEPIPGQPATGYNLYLLECVNMGGTTESRRKNSIVILLDAK